ncbi:MAG: hypothetical protein KBS40_01370 [Bacteroidales bacterium]|nr:hypothetical protein [Bacteroidales bacterium]
MKYDKFTADQMAGELKLQCATTANQILERFDALVTYPGNTPLQNYHNALLCFQEAEGIVHQALGAALDQLRVEKPELFKPANYCFAPELRNKELKKLPVIEYDGCKIRLGVFADFSNQGRKDTKIGMLINNLRINYRQGESMYRNLVKAIDEFLKKKENKRAKPTTAEETLVFEDVKYAFEG